MWLNSTMQLTNVLVVELAYTTVLETVIYKFESCQGHHKQLGQNSQVRYNGVLGFPNYFKHSRNSKVRMESL